MIYESNHLAISLVSIDGMYDDTITCEPSIPMNTMQVANDGTSIIVELTQSYHAGNMNEKVGDENSEMSHFAHPHYLIILRIICFHAFM